MLAQVMSVATLLVCPLSREYCFGRSLSTVDIDNKQAYLLLVTDNNHVKQRW